MSPDAPPSDDEILSTEYSSVELIADLAKIRQARGLSLAQVGRRMTPEVSRQKLWQWESGVHAPPLDRFAGWADVLAHRLVILLVPASHSEIAEAIAAFRKVLVHSGPVQRMTLIRYIRDLADALDDDSSQS